MPEVRRGSNLYRAQSDPVIPSEGADNDVLSPLPSRASLNPPTRPRPLQQTHAQSADGVPITNQPSPGSRIGSFFNRRPSNNPDASTGGLSIASNGDGVDGAPPRKASIFGSAVPDASRQSLSYALRPQAEAYYDSRAAGHEEWARRAKDLQEYYEDNPDLLPQLPFTWHHGNRRWRLWFFAFVVFVDGAAVPIALYYGMKYAGNVQEYIIFIIVTTIWGGPSYLEFAIRTLRLMKVERFYRPLGTTSRWCADSLTWSGALTIFVLTVLFIVGSAPRDTWLRVVTMAAVSILWCLGGVLMALQLLHRYHIPAPFRISSSGKGEEVLPGVYYFIEDVMAVNAGCGRPFREALMARYRASPRFREMLNEQSWFYAIGSLVMATILSVIAIIPQVPENWGYGVCWTATFGWAFVWASITIPWCKKRMVRERLEWEAGKVPGKTLSPSLEEGPADVASPIGGPPVEQRPPLDMHV